MNTQSTKEQVLIIKQEEKYSAEEVVARVKALGTGGERLAKSHEFSMPKVEVKHERQVKELLDQLIENEKFQDYFIG